MSKHVAQVVLPTIKDYRGVRDDLFAELGETQHGTPAYDALRRKIYDLDETHDHFIDESAAVHVESLNFGDIKRTFEHIPQNIGIDPNHIIDSIRGEFQHILSETAAPVAKQAFRTSAAVAAAVYEKFQSLEQSKPALVDAINAFALPASLSVVQMEYDGFYRRAEGLCRLLTEQSEHFQFNRHAIRWVLENTGPSKIGVNFSGELFTSVFSFSIGGTMPWALGVEIVDVILEKAGVPE